MKHLNVLFVSICTIAALTANANQQMDIPPERPRLVVNIIVSQMRFDHLHNISNQLGSKGFRLINSEGAVCRNARYNYLLTQSHPGVTTIATGTNPSMHGIVSNKWYSRSSNDEVTSTGNDRVITIGGSYFNGMHSPKNIITSTLGDELRMSNARSKVFGISLEPAHAILSSGHNANGAFWFDYERGAWITSNHYMDSLPTWASEFNAKELAKIYGDREWTLNKPLTSYSEGDTTQVSDPDVLSRLMKKLKSLANGIIPSSTRHDDYSNLLENPYGNMLTKDFAIATIIGENLGKDEHTDYLAISFTPSQPIGQKHGPHSIEMEDTFLKLDAELAHFISFLNTEVGKHNYLLILTSDHGVSATPMHLKESKIPGGYFNPMHAMALLGSYLNAIYGTGDWVSGYHQKQIYLNQRLIEDSNIPLTEFQQRVANFMIRFTGVANTATGHTLQTSNFTSGVFEKFQNSYNQSRSGDIIINLKPGWVERSSNLTSGNSPYNYDTHVPLVWYGWKIRRRQILTPVSMTDIAPTLSTLLGISWPNGSIGNPILQIIE